MRKQLLFSIIIPVYNTNPDLFECCIRSLKELDKEKYELIIIDDGSLKKNSDKYKKILEESLLIYYYLKIDNLGVSNARNIGIKKAKGKYILFVDADDEIIATEVNYDVLMHDYDLVFYNTILISGINKTINKEINVKNSGIIEKKDLISQIIIKDSFNSPVAKFYKREKMLNEKLYFDSKFIHGEDTDFNIRFLNRAEEFFFIDRELYIYKFDYLHYEKRWKKNMKAIMNNLFLNYQSRLRLIEGNNLDNSLIRKVKNDVISQLFRMKLTNYSIKRITNKQFKEYFFSFNIKPKDISINNKIKYLIIINNNNMILSLMVFFRKKHLERKMNRK